MLFSDGSREPLHGHNYRVRVRGETKHLENDMVFDFLHIKPIVKELCDHLDHKLLIPQKSPHLSFKETASNIEIMAQGDFFSIPRPDLLFLPIVNTSVEVIAAWFAGEIEGQVRERHQFCFTTLEVEVEESPGQSAVFVLGNGTGRPGG